MHSLSGERAASGGKRARTRMLYLRLALNNLKGNKQTFFPYMLACVGTVAMFFMLHAIANNPGLMEMVGAAYLEMIMNFGVIVIGIFAALLLIYTNSFVIKRRKREFALYTILGMEKRHVARVLMFETLFTSCAGIAGGFLAGALLSRLMFLLLSKILHTQPFGFVVHPDSFTVTLALFGAIFAVILLGNMRQIHLAQPIGLLRDSSAGEREPKARWALALLGLLCLGGGYWIALTTESPLQALLLFFVAVVLVIAGTYMLFTTGSIALLKTLRKNKRFYYKSAHFTGIAGMMYRMKQNAAGLASICILSTTVLVMVSGTVSMNVGADRIIDAMYPRDMIIQTSAETPKALERVKETALTALAAQGAKGDRALEFRSIDFVATRQGAYFETDSKLLTEAGACTLHFIPLEDYNRHAGRSASLAQGEALVYAPDGYGEDTVEVLDKTYVVKEVLGEYPFGGVDATIAIPSVFVTVPGMEDLHAISRADIAAYGEMTSDFNYYLGLDIGGDEARQTALKEAVRDDINKNLIEEGPEEGSISLYVDVKTTGKQDFYTMYGSFLFLGLFLGSLFVMATVLIIYYKQISEGYDDRQRFSIMQKVGMSKQEIRRTIRSQVLIVFFLPLGVAVIHLAAASKMLMKLLAMFNVGDATLFFACAAAAIAAFALLYTGVYSLTARTYYRIVGG